MAGEGETATNSLQKEKVAAGIRRELFRLDGTKVATGDTLAEGQVYMMVLYGAGKAEEAVASSPLWLSIPSSDAFKPMAAASGEAETFSALWPWLPTPLTKLEGVASTP